LLKDEAKDRWTSGSKYERWMGRWSRLLAREFVRWLEPAAGLRWIDVCCGSGIVSRIIAEEAAPESILGVDISPQQISFARESNALEHVTFEVADAMALPMPDASFDIAVCGLGLNFIPEPAAGLHEMRRVLRPDGSIALYVWDYEKGARFLRIFWDTAKEIDPEAVAFDQGSRFPMCTEAGIRKVMKASGHENVRVQALDIVTAFASFEDYWQPFLEGQGSAPTYIASRTPEMQGKIRDRLQSRLPDERFELPARAWAVCARRN